MAKARVEAVMRRCGAAALRRSGRRPGMAITVLSDGEDGMRPMLGRWRDPALEHRLDWWHLYRRLERMREGSVHLPRVPGDDFLQRLRTETAAIEHIRWTLWNGCECVHAADVAITEFRIDLDDHLRAARAARCDVARIEAMQQQLDEFRRYMYANAESLVNYNIARLWGERVSTAHVESTVNQLVNKRMCRRQQICWSHLGAQLLLHVRTAILNGRLARYVRGGDVGAPANDNGAAARRLTTPKFFLVSG